MIPTSPLTTSADATYAREFVEDLWRTGRAYLSVLSVHELHVGMEPEEEAATEAFVGACRVLEVDRRVAKAGAEWYRK